MSGIESVMNEHETQSASSLEAILAADEFAGWASEIAADAFAFVHTGYAAVAALHDVVAGTPAMVVQYNLGDPHPISYLRVLLAIDVSPVFWPRPLG